MSDELIEKGLAYDGVIATMMRKLDANAGFDVRRNGTVHPVGLRITSPSIGSTKVGTTLPGKQPELF